jgi:hypothetical protein
MRQLLVEISERNRDSLELVTAALDGAVQYVYAEHSRRFGSQRIDGSVLATNVRDQMFFFVELPAFEGCSFTFKSGSNRSVLMTDQHLIPVRIRKHPRIRNSSNLVPVTPPVEVLSGPNGEVLFGGAEFSAASWVPVLLWDAREDTQTLDHAWLGALERTNQTPRVFERIPLEIGSPSLLTVPDGATRPLVHLNDWNDMDGLDDFDDMFPDEEAGTDPA